ncbi:MAG TPA: TonB-dependent receptor [Arenimonas sp.]|nr:TonB-dependent receptor [Arenimonas sp.]
MRKNKLALAVAIAITFALPVHAQDKTTTENAVELDSVEVTGVRIAPLPQAEATLDSSGIKAKSAATSDTAQLLEDIPGLSLYGNGGVSSLPVMRGFADDRLRIQVDGIDLISACANHMNPPLSYIDPSSIGRIEVFAGITPVSLGGDSLGGTIMVESVAPEFAENNEAMRSKGSAGLFYRSNGNAYGANVSALFAGENFSFTYNGSTAHSDNYRAGDDFKPAGLAAAGREWLDGDEVGSSYYKSTNQSIGLAFRQDNHLFELKYGQQDIPRQGFPNQRMDMTRNDSKQLNLRYKGVFAWGALEAGAYREDTRHSMQFGDDKLFWYGPTAAQDGQPGPTCATMGPTCYAAGMPMDTEGKNTGVHLKANITLSERDLLRIGTDIQQYRLDDYWLPSGRMMAPNTFWNIRDGERDRLAAFAEWEANWNTRWLTQLGIRFENVSMDAGPVQSYNPMFSQPDANAFNAADRSRNDGNLDMTALSRFTPSATQTFEFGIAQKTRSPNLYERYAWSTHGMAMRMVNFAGDGNGYVGNLALKPETATSLSLNADWHDAGNKRWNLHASAYVNEIDDYIDAERCFSATPFGMACTADNLTRQTGFVYLQFVNQSARIYGFDLSAKFPIAENSRFGSLSGKAIVSYSHGENETTGDNLYNIMPLNAEFVIEQKHGAWTHRLEAEFVSAKNEVSAVRNEVETAGYAIAHLRGSYEWKKLRLDFGIENIFDRFYTHPLGGAYLGQGKTMPGTDVPWGLSVPGKGRSLYAGLNFEF